MSDTGDNSENVCLAMVGLLTIIFVCLFFEQSVHKLMTIISTFFEKLLNNGREVHLEGAKTLMITSFLLLSFFCYVILSNYSAYVRLFVLLFGIFPLSIFIPVVGEYYMHMLANQ